MTATHGRTDDSSSTVPSEELLDSSGQCSLLREACDIILSYRDSVSEGNTDESKVLDFASPLEIEQKFAEIGIDLSLKEDAALDDPSILKACEKTLDLSVRTSHPLFFNQLYGKVDPVGLVGDLLVTASNTNAFTYEVAPVYTLIERAMIQKFCRLVGGDFASTGEGVFVPGGSIANLYGMHLGRFWKCPEVKTEGMGACGCLVAFVNEDCHYSYDKAAHVLGLGSKNLVKVKADALGRMDPAELRKEVSLALASGKRPFFVGATAGTTVRGAFDDLEALRDVCDEFRMWLHVDGAWGGAVTVLRGLKEEEMEEGDEEILSLVKGVERADSFCWNPHKMLGAPLQCSAFMVRDRPGFLKECNQTCAPYLFQEDKNFSKEDLGDWTIQCSRKPDAFKVWLMWLKLRDVGAARRVRDAVHLTRVAAEELRRREGFVLAHDPSYANVCFWYVPSALRRSLGTQGIWDVSPSSELGQKLRRVGPYVKGELQKQGGALITFTGKFNFFRWVFASPLGVSREEVIKTLNSIQKAAESMNFDA